MIPSALSDFLEQLQDLAYRVDRDRLLVLYPEFAREYPDVARSIEGFVCAETPEIGRERLFRDFPSLGVLWPFAPPEWRERLEIAFKFLHQTLHGRIKHGKLIQ